MGEGGHELSGVLLDTERAPSNIIWILFDYIFFRLNIHKKGTFQNVGVEGCAPPVPTPLYTSKRCLR